MARKQALRELQTRLAERMRLARTQARGRAWLAVECAGRGFLIPLAEAGEIFSAVPLVALPYAQPWCLGVANLRGQLHTVVDLAGFLGVTPAPGRSHPGGQHAGRDPSPQLLAFNPALEINAALRLDRLAGLRDEAQMAPLQEDPAAADKSADERSPRGAVPRPSFAGARLRDAEGRVWQVLSLVALAGHGAFLRVGG